MFAISVLLILFLLFAFYIVTDSKNERFYTSGATMRDNTDFYLSYNNVQEAAEPGFYNRYKYRTT
jgi:hypothetical protein